MKPGPQGECPTCQPAARTITIAVLDRLDEQIEALIADGKYFKPRLEQLEDLPADVVRELESGARCRCATRAGERANGAGEVQRTVEELAQRRATCRRRSSAFSSCVTTASRSPSGYDAARHAR